MHVSILCYCSIQCPHMRSASIMGENPHTIREVHIGEFDKVDRSSELLPQRRLSLGISSSF